jgi:DNA helicase-2/ATP-dependent DNA helicase PcrA
MVPNKASSGAYRQSDPGDVVAETHAETHAERDDEMERIVSEEQRVLNRVLQNLAGRHTRRTGRIDYDQELVSLRDQISEARLEDVPALVAQMERLQQVAARRADIVDEHVDIGSPYFGRIVLQEGERKREVLIGRSTYLDPRTGVQIVDWRDAPVSRVYYRYDEGDDYDEQFGGRLVEGEVLTRRSLAIHSSELRRIASVQGTFLRRTNDSWVRLGESSQLKGGQGSAPRPSNYQPVGKLGVTRDGIVREDKHLPEIAALIDARQFELITKPDSGLVVIQGGAGSGKTTIGLHRLAYLAYRDSKRFRHDRMLVVVFNDALARYISFVLPALGVAGVAVTTFHAWARKLRVSHVPKLSDLYTDETPEVVTRLKKHPAWLRILDEHAAALEAMLPERLVATFGAEQSKSVLQHWHATRGQPVVSRAKQLLAALDVQPPTTGEVDPKSGSQLGFAGFAKPESSAAADADRAGTSVRHAAEREARILIERGDVISLWSELLTDRRVLFEQFQRHAPGEFTQGQIDSVVRWCDAHCSAALTEIEEREARREAREAREEEEDAPGEPEFGIDGLAEKSAAMLDWEDDALLLRIYQRVQGPLRRGKEVASYEHVFVDEAQDLSPLELAVVLGTSRSESVTLAGDVAQRLMLDNGFSDWKGVLGQLGLQHVEIEPLRVSYRSTQEIMEFANAALGPLRTEEAGIATRRGVPVELFRFVHTGDAVGFLAESLRALIGAEPLASIAVIARHPEQVREYAEGLMHAEVPNTRLIAAQDFPFKAGVDVTDVRQVKGLEFDYVVLVDVTAQSYPDDDESRHLLHIAASRAAHQLWIMTNDSPSPLLPRELVERGY